MEEKVAAIEYRCDGCSFSEIRANNDEKPLGYYMEVYVIHPHGGVAVKVYSHKKKCIGKAIETVLNREDY